MVDVPAYLARIEYAGSTNPTVQTLRAIHRAHLLTVPFENLDISLGRGVVVDENVNVRKIVERHRGGFCFELNGAFAALLRALGFKVTLLSARVAGDAGRESPEFDHLTLRIDLEEPWLADVGFGESFLEPLKMQYITEQQDPAGTFRLMRYGERVGMEMALSNGGWKPQYSFSLQPRSLKDFTERCHFHQTSPESYFMQNRICTRATPEGRTTLSGMKLIVTRNGQREERVLDSEEEWIRILQDQFGISVL